MTLLALTDVKEKITQQLNNLRMNFPIFLFQT